MNKIIKNLNQDRINIFGVFPIASVPEWFDCATFNPSYFRLLNLLIVDCVLHSFDVYFLNFVNIFCVLSFIRMMSTLKSTFCVYLPPSLFLLRGFLLSLICLAPWTCSCSVSISSREFMLTASKGQSVHSSPTALWLKASWWGNDWICGSAPGLFLLLGFSPFCDIDVVACSQSYCSSSLMWMQDSLPLNPGVSVLNVLFSNTSLRLTDWTSCHHDCLHLCRRWVAFIVPRVATLTSHWWRPRAFPKRLVIKSW